MQAYIPINPIDKVTGKSISAALSLMNTATGLVGDSIFGIAGMTAKKLPKIVKGVRAIIPALIALRCRWLSTLRAKGRKKRFINSANLSNILLTPLNLCPHYFCLLS